MQATGREDARQSEGHVPRPWGGNPRGVLTANVVGTQPAEGAGARRGREPGGGGEGQEAAKPLEIFKARTRSCDAALSDMETQGLVS